MARHVQTVVRAATAAGPDIRLLTLIDPDGWPLPRFRPGAHIDLHLPGMVRTYSLCGDPRQQDRYLIAVKRESGGHGGSAWLHDTVAVGDPLGVSLPRCTFPLAADATEHVFVAGGIGVTPFLSMLHASVASRLHVLHRGAPPLPELLAPFADRVVLHDTAAAPRPSLATLLRDPAPGRHAYCCGPAAMIEAFEGATAAWPDGHAHVEHFVPPPLSPDPTARPYRLVLARSGRGHDMPAGANLLAALRDLGATVDASCEGGICGACRVPWLEGPPLHRDRVLSPAERERDVMVCVAGCAGPRLVLDL